ncbi:ATP-grasp domain-containing protein [Streptomyces bambusae]|uniref:ATP-grasp domain-containing protein n=1 Tax=Streptomyces bambusae TaxID=1550616 RepID=UPI001CFCBCBC|nr:ATP-grasp domain-containing protein [Streptomyces bambusae]MCB5165019.1 ATP-grasp domain-containing protein [Streptomyces bambusae]
MNSPVVIVVDPTSTGISLSAACAEYGAHVVHLWQSGLKDTYSADPHPHKLLCTGTEDALDALTGLAPVAVCPGSEYGVTFANQLSAELGLPHNDLALAGARRDKNEMLGAVSAAGLPTGWSKELYSAAEVEEFLTGLDAYPVVVKPANSAGSDGCAVCYSADDLRTAYEAIAGQENYLGETNSRVLVQEFIDGPQYIVDTVSIGGRHLLSDVFLYRIDEVDGRPLIRDAVLLKELNEAEQDAVRYVMSCLDALGLKEGAAHTEVRLTTRGPRLIEVNARLMGPIQPADVYTAALGYSHATLLAESLLDRPRFEQRFDQAYRPQQALAMVLLRIYREGTITAMPGLAEIRRLPGFHSFLKLPALGTAVSPANPLTVGTTGLAFFAHVEPDVVDKALAELHVMEDADAVFTVG